MAQTFAQLTKQIEALKAEAERLRKQEIGETVQRIREAVQTYGLTRQDLFGPTTAKAPATRRKARGAKFADESGNTWGGRGPRPTWLRNALAAGRTLDEFRA